MESTRTFYNESLLTTTISGDGRKALASSRGCFHGGDDDNCCVWFKLIPLIVFVLTMILSFAIEHRLSDDVIYVTSFMTGAVYSLRLIGAMLGTHNTRYEVYDLDDWLPLPIRTFPERWGQVISGNFDSASTTGEGSEAMPIEQVHPMFRHVQQASNDENPSLTSIRVDHFEPEVPRRVTISSMDRRTRVSVEDAHDGRIVTLLPSCRAFTSIFELD